MTTQRDKAKWWRLRFSVRTLAIVVTLVCAYFGLWGPTQDWAQMDVYNHVNDYQGLPALPPASKFSTSAIAPLIVEANWLGMPHSRYVWFFGFVVELPMETTELDEFMDEQLRFAAGDFSNASPRPLQGRLP